VLGETELAIKCNLALDNQWLDLSMRLLGTLK